MNTTTSGENDNDDMHTLFPKVTPIQFTVEVADDIMINSIASVTAAVTFLYQAPDKESNGEESQLLSMLLQELNSQVVDPVDRKFSFTSDPTLLQMEFLPMKESSGAILLKVLAPSGYTSTEVGLIVATSFLSVVLVLVSSVLLYITGGWKTCMTKCTNCLFEEVDDDEYDGNKMQIHAISSKNTYRMKSTDVDDNDDDGDNESQSQLTSIPPSSASGILGVVRNRDHPTLGTFPSPGGSDDDDATGSAMYGDSTPISRSNINALPLGITSMRKLPPSYSSPEGEERVGGFSGMFMQRLTRSSGKKK